VPVRAAPVLVATENATVPLPMPALLPIAIVIHAAFDVAVHAHVGADAAIATEPGPPASVALWDVGASVNVQAGGAGGGGVGAAAWLTVNV